jgi:putative membrane protein
MANSDLARDLNSVISTSQFPIKVNLMKKIYFISSFAVMLLTSACSKEQENNNVNAADHEFMTQLAWNMKTEIAAAQIASSKSENPEVRTHVQNLIAEYKPAQTELHKLAASLNVSLENIRAEEHVSILSRLEALSGSEFDATYMQGSVQSQQTILDIFQKAFNEGNNGNVKGYVHRYIDLIERHFLNSDRIARNL